MQEVHSKEAITAAVLKGHSEATVLVGTRCCGSQGHAQGPPRPKQPPGTAVTPAARSFFEISAVGGQISEKVLLERDHKLIVDEMRGNGHKDILEDDVFTEALTAASRANWVHAAPAAGFIDDRSKDAEAARRTAAVAQAAVDGGNNFTIEGPSASRLWELKPFRRLAAAPGTRKLELSLDGGKISILTNAVWAEIAEARVAEQGHLAIKASLHRALVQASGEMHSRGPSNSSTWTRAGYFGNVLLRLPAGRTSATASAAAFRFGRRPIRAGQESKKEKREEENLNAIGGLRNPNQAVARSPQLRAVGRWFGRTLSNNGRQRTLGHRRLVTSAAALWLRHGLQWPRSSGQMLQARARVTRESSSGGSFWRQATLRQSSSIGSATASLQASPGPSCRWAFSQV